MKTLEEEICELQEFNEDCENELFQMRADIDRLEEQIKSTKRVSLFSLCISDSILYLFYAKRSFVNTTNCCIFLRQRKTINIQCKITT